MFAKNKLLPSFLILIFCIALINGCAKEISKKEDEIVSGEIKRLLTDTTSKENGFVVSKGYLFNDEWLVEDPYGCDATTMPPPHKENCERLFLNYWDKDESMHQISFMFEFLGDVTGEYSLERFKENFIKGDFFVTFPKLSKEILKQRGIPIEECFFEGPALYPRKCDDLPVGGDSGIINKVTFTAYEDKHLKGIFTVPVNIIIPPRDGEEGETVDITYEIQFDLNLNEEKIANK